MKNFNSLIALLLLATLFTSCGVMFYGAKQKVNVQSTPAGAKIFVNGEYTGQTTPADINITRRVKDSPTSVKQKMSYTLKKDGFKDYKQVDNSKFNIASFIGSTLLGGAIGIAIDAGVGVNRSYPKFVQANLTEGSSSNSNGLLIDRSQEVDPGTGVSSANNITTTPTAKSNNSSNTNEKSTSNAGTISITPSTMDKKENETTAVTLSNTNEVSETNNYRENQWKEIKENSINVSSNNTTTPGIVKTEASQVKKIKKSEENIAAKGLKYRRSSLYTLMVNDPDRQYSSVIKNSFGNEKVPQKFNDHNVGPYYINSIADLKTQEKIIDTYLNENNVAKLLVAKWFLRDDEGKFSMDLIAKRGMYDASAIDKVIANSSERGNSMLADAGEELIGKTFIIINDYKFTSKEELANKTKKGLNFVKNVSSFAGVDVSGVTDLASTAVTIAGKGYIIKSTSYLYRLVWDEEAAAIFYNNYWTDNNSYDPAKVEAFNKATNFKLKYVGVQSAWADVQSSVFTDKSEEDLVQMATIKATDKAIAKLERKFEEFRTMTPLFSADPLAAKIGLKEGLEKGDKFEVLEQQIDAEGKTTYKRVGIIKVDGANIWDNTLNEEEREKLKNEGKLATKEYTIFKGGGKYYPGQLIKQIN